MSEFHVFKKAISKKFEEMQKHDLFITNVDKDDLWSTYLSSFPEGTNPIFIERTEHDCNCCKQFIRAVGNVVAIIDNKLVSIWDVEVDNFYQDVADAMSIAVKKKKKISNAFLHYEASAGTDKNVQHAQANNGDKADIIFHHFYVGIHAKFVKKEYEIGTILSKSKSNQAVFMRGMKELSLDAAETVLELIEQNSLYRGEEHEEAVKAFITQKKKFDKIAKKLQGNYCWAIGYSGVRNTAIGTLITDISDGVGLNKSVASFESKVAPANYKRSSAVVTKGMLDNAKKIVEELGIEPSLFRRYAHVDDITIPNVLFADRKAKKEMGVLDDLVKTPTKIKNLDKVEEVDIKTFVESILPKADSIEIMVDNNHINNFMSLIAPVNPDAPNILKWGNNYSWAYKGEVADSMKDRVKKAGGNITGDLRFSIQWNENNDNGNDFDAHCKEPNGNLIYYQKRGQRQPSSGMLDVDIINPNGKVAVENIVYNDKSKMPEGDYLFRVHNFSDCGGRSGFRAEIEFDGVIHSYNHDKVIKDHDFIDVAIVQLKKGVFSIASRLESSQTSNNIWGIDTHQFSRVSMIMNSPNHWDGEKTGNKHYFFMLEGCLNDQKARGFFNEFLNEDLREHRKVFEVLGSKLKCEESDNQLSGVGFSSTQRNQLLCKVSGSFSRIIKINF